MSFQTTYGPDGRLRVAILGCTGSIGTVSYTHLTLPTKA